MERMTAPARAEHVLVWFLAKRSVGGDGMRASPRAPRHERWCLARFNSPACGQAVPDRVTAQFQRAAVKTLFVPFGRKNCKMVAQIDTVH